MDLDYRIVVPSRKRSGNMKRIRRLLPSATICVDEREEKAYSKVVPKGNLMIHPPLDGLPRILNWLRTEVKEEIMVKIDDDLEYIEYVTMANKHLKIDNHESILEIIENSCRMIVDLDLTMFIYGKAGALAMSHEIPFQPFSPTAGCSGQAYGVRGAARMRRNSVVLEGREDADFILQTLLKDRCLLRDNRYVFWCGQTYHGFGGAAGRITEEHSSLTKKRFKEKWGRHVSFGKSWFVTGEVTKLSVKRRCP